LTPRLRELRARCDLVVLLSQLGLKRDEALAERLPGPIDLILGNSHAQTLHEPKRVGHTVIVPTSSEGQQLGVVEVTFTNAGPQFAQRFIPLDESVADDPDMAQLIDDYRAREAKALVETSAAQPAPAPADPDELVQAEYLPAERCGRGRQGENPALIGLKPLE